MNNNNSTDLFVTVLTPTYNRFYKITDLFSSLKRQTDINFEWLVIDDGSKDETKEFFKQVEKDKIPFAIKYVYKENGGKHTAINYSHKYIKGSIVVIVDSDDYLSDDAIEVIRNTWMRYKERKDVKGIVFQRGIGDTKVPIDSSIKGEYITDFIKARNNGMKGDHCETVLTERLLKYEFPIFKGEKFVPEGGLWYSVYDNCKIVCSDKVIYHCKYLDDGLTKGGRFLRLKNPLGCAYEASYYMDPRFNFRTVLRNTLKYICYSRLSKMTIAKIVSLAKYKSILFYLCLIPGEIMYRMWEKKYND